MAKFQHLYTVFRDVLTSPFKFLSSCQKKGPTSKQPGPKHPVIPLKI